MDQWNIIQQNFDERQARKYETLFTLANGYRGLRGSEEFAVEGERGNYISGIFDKATAQVTELVNNPNPLSLNLYLEDEKVDLKKCEVLKYDRQLNMQQGILTTEIKVKTSKGKIIEIEIEKFVSRKNVNRWAGKYSVKSVNFKAKLFIENIIDGTITNGFLDPANKTKHFNVTNIYDMDPGIGMKTATLDKNIKVMEITTIISKNENGNLLKKRKFNVFGENARELYEVFLNEGESIEFFKYGVTYTSRDTEQELCHICGQELNRFLSDGFEREKENHINEWLRIWDNIDIKIEGDEEAQLGIRFNLYHLASSAYSEDTRVSIAAKALHGEGYKGHIFWDTETFMLPFFIYTQPEVAKALLMYRYNTLDGAKRNAASNGFKGAQFPWESADTGEEVTPKWGVDYYGNPVRIWTGDEEYHINSDITFAILEYYRATNDKEFLLKYGLEILFETTKFWGSRVEYNENEDRYEINKVIGPDEFHEHINNNVYTNYLAKWSIKKALEFVQWLKIEDTVQFDRLCNKVGLNNKEFARWNEIQRKIYIPMSEDGKIIEQFEGYFNLKDYEITEYDQNEMPVWPEGCDLSKLNETQLIKQADVVILMIMLGEEFDEEVKKENYKFYEARTMHKSSLSPSMYSIMGLTVGDTNNSYKYFMKTILTDLKDNQGNTDFGLHAASTGGSWQSAVFGFGGLNVDKKGIINFNPWIPKHWRSMSFITKWRGSNVKITISQENVELQAEQGIKIKIYGKEYNLDKNNKTVINR
jgi:kojibiose phosphorylase